MPPVILCGLGFTTRRLARRLLFRGVPTYAAVRNAQRFQDLAAMGLRFGDFPPQAVVVHSVPPLPLEENSALREFVSRLKPRRVVYISSTGVYGNLSEVDASSAPAASEEKGRRRIDEENWLLGGEWQTLIVRPAAIYGPGRGVHMRILEGREPRSEPGGITSRIHVDDLAAVLERGALSDLTGAWPVADELPCATLELAAWCAGLMRKEIASAWRDSGSVAAGRSVDGRRILEMLDVELMYPTYESGVLASLAEAR